VFLSRDETKAINAARPKERLIGKLLAIYAEIVSVAIHLRENGTANAHIWKLGVLVFAGVLFFVLSMKGNRLLIGLGALLCVYIPMVEGPKISPLFFFFLIPLYAFMMYLALFKISSDRRKAIDARIKSGDYGTNPRFAGKASSSATAATAQTDAAGRSIAPASKRYTPPKAKGKK
jgi:peptidoglycan/LPS O-acetylase OafA/YrhL